MPSDLSELTKRPLLLLRISERCRAVSLRGLELGSYLTGDDSRGAGGWPRGVASRSPLLEGCLRGELIARLLCDRRPVLCCVDLAGDDPKKRGEEDGTALPFCGCGLLGLGVF